MKKNNNTQLKPMDTPIYSYWKALYSCFFSRRLYVDVGKRWRGFGFLYLLLVVAILSVPLALRVGVNFRDNFQENVVNPLLQLPPLYVQNGIISIEKPVPYFIKNKQGDVVLIIDTSGKITNFTPEFPKLSILINKDVLYYRVPSPSLMTTQGGTVNQAAPIAQRLDKTVNAVFDGSEFVNQPSVIRLKYTSEFLVYPIVVVAMYTFFMVVFPAIAMLAQIFSNVFFTFQIKYFQASRLLVVAATPMMLALFIYLTINIPFMSIGIILVGLLVIYYCFALYSLRAESREVATL